MWRNPPICRLRSTAIAAIFACLSQVAWSPAAFAQTETYSVLGQAYLSGSDGEHFGVAGAAVELHSLSEVEPEPSSPDSQGPAVAETNELGLFRFDGLAEGCYYLIGTSPGMSGQSDIACVPSEEAPLRIDVELEVDTVVESVNVTASVIAIDPTETTSSGSVGGSRRSTTPRRRIAASKT